MTDATAVRTERRAISAFSFARVRRKAGRGKGGGKAQGGNGMAARLRKCFARGGIADDDVQSVASVRACVII